MSDEIFDTEEEGGAAEGAGGEGKKRVGFLPSVVIDILKWTAIIIGAIIFIVVTVVITVRILNTGSQVAPSNLPQQSAYENESLPMLAWFSQIGEVRGVTLDEVRRTFIVGVHIGYEPESEATLQELIGREVQLTEVIAEYFSSQSINDLQGLQNRQSAKEELRERINRIMINNVSDVAFARYEFLEF